MSLLTIVESFCRRTGLSVPSGVVGSTNNQIQQILGLVNELIEELTYSPYEYTATRVEAIFTTVEGADQGALSTLAAGFVSLVPNTMYNRTQQLRVDGPISLQEWQALEATAYTGTAYRYMVRSGHLYFMPTVATGQEGDEVAFEYNSNYMVLDSTGVPKSSFTADTDTCALPEAILLLGLRWKWREEKGLDFGSLRDTYYNLLKTYQAKDGTKPVIDLSQSGPRFETGIIVPIQGIGQ